MHTDETQTYGRPRKWDDRIPEIVAMYNQEKISRGEISRRTDIPLNTVTRLLQRAGVDFENRMSATRQPLSEEHKAAISQSKAGIKTGIRSAMKAPRMCPHCEMTYQPSSAKQKYCSRKCRNIARSQEERDIAIASWQNDPGMKCSCGERIPYESRNTAKYCSIECRKRFAPKRTADPKNQVTFNCSTCQTEVTRPRNYGGRTYSPSGTAFCSNECASKLTKVKRHVVLNDSDVVLDSGWEALVWGLCTYLKIPIERFDRTKAIPFKNGWYGPDFMIPDGDSFVYIEVKGYEDEDDIERCEAFRALGHRLVVIDHLVLSNIIGMNKGDFLTLLGEESALPSMV